MKNALWILFLVFTLLLFLQADALPHLLCDLPFTLHVINVKGFEDGSVESTYARRQTLMSVDRRDCVGNISKVTSARVVREKKTEMQVQQMPRQKCVEVKLVKADEDLSLHVILGWALYPISMIWQFQDAWIFHKCFGFVGNLPWCRTCTWCNEYNREEWYSDHDRTVVY